MTCPPSWPKPTSLLTESILSTTQNFCFWKLATFSLSYIIKQNKVILEKKLCLHPHWPPCNSMTVLSIPIMFLLSYHLWEEKAMAPHSSTLAWKIPWMEESCGVQSMGSLRVGHNWATSLSLFTFMHWRRKWQPTPVFLPGEFQGQGSLAGCRLWGRTESDKTEVT